MSKKDPVRVVITGAAGQIGNALVPMIASGLMFGPDQPVIIHLLEIPPAQNFLNGFMMDLQDSVYDLVAGFVPTVDEAVGFKDVDYAVLLGSFPRGKCTKRTDLLEKNKVIYQGQAKMMSKYAKKDVKVLVVGNPCNSLALVFSHYAEGIPKENITCMTRLDMNRNIACIAHKCGVRPSQVKNVFNWGNHSYTQYPTCDHGYVQMDDGKKVPCREIVNDDEWVDGTYIDYVRNRGGDVIKTRGKTATASAAKAACDQMRDWILGTKEGDIVCMGVASTGDYGVPEGIVFSYPVTCKDGKYEIVKGLPISEGTKKGLELSAKELLDEKKMAFENSEELS